MLSLWPFNLKNAAHIAIKLFIVKVAYIADLNKFIIIYLYKYTFNKKVWYQNFKSVLPSIHCSELKVIGVFLHYSIQQQSLFLAKKLTEMREKQTVDCWPIGLPQNKERVG